MPRNMLVSPAPGQVNGLKAEVSDYPRRQGIGCAGHEDAAPGGKRGS